MRKRCLREFVGVAASLWVAALYVACGTTSRSFETALGGANGEDAGRGALNAGGNAGLSTSEAEAVAGARGGMDAAAGSGPATSAGRSRCLSPA